MTKLFLEKESNSESTSFEALKEVNDIKILKEISKFCNNLNDREEVFLFYTLVKKMSEKYSLVNLIEFLQNNFSSSSILVPYDFFLLDLSPYEALSFYLYSFFNIKIKNISSLLGKSESSVWLTLNNAKKKYASFSRKIKEQKYSSKYFFDLNYYDKKKSVLANLIFYLVDNYHLSLKEVSLVLNRKLSSLWSTFRKYYPDYVFSVKEKKFDLKNIDYNASFLDGSSDSVNYLNNIDSYLKLLRGVKK